MNTVTVKHIKMQSIKDILLKLFDQLKDVELCITQSQGRIK